MVQRPELTPDAALAGLLDAFPELEAPELDADDLADPYLVFGELGLAGWLERLAAGATSEDLLRRVLAFVEDLLGAGSREVRTLVATALLEAIVRRDAESDASLVSRLARFMGPKTLYLLGEVQAFWNGTLDAFHEATPSPWGNSA